MPELYKGETVPADIQRRADLGWEWFKFYMSPERREQAAAAARKGYMNMGDNYSDVIALAHGGQNSESILVDLGLDTEAAQELGLRHAAAGGLNYEDRSDRQDREVAQEYHQLTVAWYRHLTAASAFDPKNPLQATTSDLLNAIKNLESQ